MAYKETKDPLTGKGKRHQNSAKQPDKILDVPFYAQRKDYTCGAATLKMVFEFFGKHRKEDLLSKHMKTNTKTGTMHAEMIEEVGKENLYCYVNDKSNKEEIFYYLSLGMPVIAHFYDPSGDGCGHYSVIKGFKINVFNQGIFVLNDPWNGQSVELWENNFLYRWGKEHNWIMVISDKEFNTGKQYYPDNKF